MGQSPIEPFVLPLFRLIYVSRAAAEHGDGAALVPAILAASRERNAAADVTGLLIAHDGRFIQVLEGPEAAVRETFERIAQDKRHRQVLIVEQAGARWRLFPLWTMSAPGLSEADAAMLGELSRRRFDPHRASADEILAVLLAVAEVHERIISTESDPG